MQGALRAWGQILKGHKPCISIEITSKCPLSCRGCYAYDDDHLGAGSVGLAELRDFHGQDLIDGVMRLIDEHAPLHVSIVGGEPLVRRKELDVILPLLSQRGLSVHLITSAVTRIPPAWASIEGLEICVSVDGLQPDHDARRAPATYEKIIDNIQGHDITVHCTITRQQVQRSGYLEEFVHQWSAMDTTRRLWVSLYTPQVGEASAERLLPGDRAHVVAELKRLHPVYPKLDLGDRTASAFLAPPASPADCIFARTTECISADLEARVTPCQLGGNPDCSECGCMASAALTAAGRYRIGGLLPVDALFNGSQTIGSIFGRRHRASASSVMRATRRGA